MINLRVIKDKKTTAPTSTGNSSRSQIQKLSSLWSVFMHAGWRKKKHQSSALTITQEFHYVLKIMLIRGASEIEREKVTEPTEHAA